MGTGGAYATYLIWWLPFAIIIADVSNFCWCQQKIKFAYLDNHLSYESGCWKGLCSCFRNMRSCCNNMFLLTSALWAESAKHVTWCHVRSLCQILCCAPNMKCIGPSKQVMNIFVISGLIWDYIWKSYLPPTERPYHEFLIWYGLEIFRKCVKLNVSNIFLRRLPSVPPPPPPLDSKISPPLPIGIGL